MLGDVKKRKKLKRINFIRSNGHSVLSDDPKTIGNTLNKYFSSIGYQLATDIPEVNTNFSNYFDPPLQNSFYFDAIIPKKLKQNLACCHTIKSVISIPLTEIFNQSVLTGVYPAKLKYAKVIPVYKGEDETLPENYRPVSLLFCKNVHCV